MTEVTGTDLIRQALNVRARKLNTANLARELGIPSSTLDAFIEGKGSLPVETLKALCVDLFHGAAEFDAELDRLRSTNKQVPKAIHPPPPIHELMELPKFKGGPGESSFRSVKPEPPVTKTKRPGWVG
jgi:hypothetical protein